jgi:hypothetical protein
MSGGSGERSYTRTWDLPVPVAPMTAISCGLAWYEDCDNILLRSRDGAEERQMQSRDIHVLRPVRIRDVAVAKLSKRTRDREMRVEKI